MYVAELQYPGVFPDRLSPEDAATVQRMLLLCEGHLSDAASALAMFQQALAERPRGPFDDGVLGDFETRLAVENELRARLPPDLSPEQRWTANAQVRDDAEALLKRRAWAAGRIPAAYLRRLPHMHARTFVFALDGIIKALEKLTALASVPPAAKVACGALKASVPDVVAVRDSAHHVEDRARGKRRRGDLPRQPVRSHGIEAPGGGVVVMDCLYENRLTYTVESGHVRDVDVSEATLAAAQQAVQATLDALSWNGPPRTVP